MMLESEQLKDLVVLPGSWRAAFADGRNSVQTRGRLFVRGALKELGTLTDGTTFAMQYCFLSLDLRF